MKTHTVTAPNICGLITCSGTPRADFIGSPGLTSFTNDEAVLEQFTSKEDAHARALEINPDYISNAIWGELDGYSNNIDTNVEAPLGSKVIIDGAHTFPDADTISYVWYKSTDMETAIGTESTYTIDSLSRETEGRYWVMVTARNSKGQLAQTQDVFDVCRLVE